MQCPFYTKQKPKYTIRCSKKVTGQSGGHLCCPTHCHNGGIYHHGWMGDLDTYPKQKKEAKKTWKILFGKSKEKIFKQWDLEFNQKISKENK